MDAGPATSATGRPSEKFTRSVAPAGAITRLRSSTGSEATGVAADDVERSAVEKEDEGGIRRIWEAPPSPQERSQRCDRTIDDECVA
jgi:hypothetical protein